MEGLNPALCLALRVKKNIERGRSVKSGILDYLEHQTDEMTPLVTRWLSLWQQGLGTAEVLSKVKSPYRRNLLLILERGLKGESIYTILLSIQEEIVLACEDEISRNIGRLPFYLLAPLLLLQLPAFILLLFGPLLTRFLEAIS